MNQKLLSVFKFHIGRMKQTVTLHEEIKVFDFFVIKFKWMYRSIHECTPFLWNNIQAKHLILVEEKKIYNA